MRRVLVNAGSNGLGFAAQMVVAFVLSPVLVHGLGTQRYGIWSLVESILAYLMLFDLGIAAAVVRYVARFDATQETDRLNRVFSTSVCLFSAAGLGALAVAAGLAVLCPSLLTIPSPLVGEARWMLLLLGFNLAVGLPLGVFPAVLDGLGRFPVKVTIRTVGLVVRAGLFLVVIAAQGGLVELAWAITACGLLEHLALAGAAWWYLPGLRFSWRLADRATFRLIRGFSLDAFVALVAGRISFQTDALVIGAFLSPAHITFFAIAGRLVEYAKNGLRAGTTALSPAVSALEAQGEHGVIRRMLLDSTRYLLWLILPVQIGLFLLGKPFLRLWMGPEIEAQSFPTLVILALPLPFVLAQSACTRVLYGIGRLRWFSRAVAVEAVVNLLLSVALVRPLGIEGVAWGTTIPNVLLTLAVVVYVCRTVRVSFGEYVRRAWLTPCALGVLLAAGWQAAIGWCPPDGWLDFLAVGLGGVTAYLVGAALVEFGWTRYGSVFTRIAPSPLRGESVATGSPSVPSA